MIVLVIDISTAFLSISLKKQENQEASCVIWGTFNSMTGEDGWIECKVHKHKKSKKKKNKYQD